MSERMQGGRAFRFGIFELDLQARERRCLPYLRSSLEAHASQKARRVREPTKPMLTEAASAGFYKSENFPEQYPRLQILTITELLAGKQLLFPRHRVETFKKAERQSKNAASQSDLF